MSRVAKRARLLADVALPLRRRRRTSCSRSWSTPRSARCPTRARGGAGATAWSAARVATHDALRRHPWVDCTSRSPVRRVTPNAVAWLEDALRRAARHRPGRGREAVGHPAAQRLRPRARDAHGRRRGALPRAPAHRRGDARLRRHAARARRRASASRRCRRCSTRASSTAPTRPTRSSPWAWSASSTASRCSSGVRPGSAGSPPRCRRPGCPRGAGRAPGRRARGPCGDLVDDAVVRRVAVRVDRHRARLLVDEPGTDVVHVRHEVSARRRTSPPARCR